MSDSFPLLNALTRGHLECAKLLIPVSDIDDIKADILLSASARSRLDALLLESKFVLGKQEAVRYI